MFACYGAVPSRGSLCLPATIRSHLGVACGLNLSVHRKKNCGKGGLHLKPQKFEHIFVAVITFFPFLLCKYFLYQLVAYCVCFKMICKKSL